MKIRVAKVVLSTVDTDIDSNRHVINNAFLSNYWYDNGIIIYMFLAITNFNAHSFGVVLLTIMVLNLMFLFMLSFAPQIHNNIVRKFI
jgi:hypothetical protein